MNEFPEYIDGVPYISGAEDQAVEVMRQGARKDLYRSAGKIDFNNARGACAVALHMHQPLIPAGGDDLQSAALICGKNSSTSLRKTSNKMASRHCAPEHWPKRQGVPSEQFITFSKT